MEIEIRCKRFGEFKRFLWYILKQVDWLSMTRKRESLVRRSERSFAGLTWTARRLYKSAFYDYMSPCLRLRRNWWISVRHANTEEIAKYSDQATQFHLLTLVLVLGTSIFFPVLLCDWPSSHSQLNCSGDRKANVRGTSGGEVTSVQWGGSSLESWNFLPLSKTLLVNSLLEPL